jgi:hypothetical protein
VRDLAVVHLVRKQNGLAPFERFLASLRSHPCGAPHDLVILFKGFNGDCADYDEVLGDIPHKRLFVPDRGFDINAYFEAVERLDYPRFCFFNSYSRILSEGWLEKLVRCFEAANVGLVGATGSCQSIAGGYTREQRRLDALPPVRRLWTRVGRALVDRRPHAMAQRAARMVLRAAGVWRPSRDFPAFPNPHLRTNAFMASRDVLRRVKRGPLRLKLSAYKFESGKDSLTNQVRAMGLRVLVVGRDGRGYDPEDWHLSNTFWQSKEENLLVADNQTELYMSADPSTRAELAQYAWGDHARPA